jgi:ketosteroid isomerase-like protein
MLQDHEGLKQLAAERQEQRMRDATDPWWWTVTRGSFRRRVRKELLVQALHDLKLEKRRSDELEVRVKQLEAALKRT